VIDPEIGDELRVTVVATGLNNSQKKRKHKPEPVKEPMRVIRNGTTGQPEPEHFKPADASPNQHASGGRFSGNNETEDLFSVDGKIDYLDIPAFLRNQAD